MLHSDGACANLKMQKQCNMLTSLHVHVCLCVHVRMQQKSIDSRHRRRHVSAVKSFQEVVSIFRLQTLQGQLTFVTTLAAKTRQKTKHANASKDLCSKNKPLLPVFFFFKTMSENIRSHEIALFLFLITLHFTKTTFPLYFQWMHTNWLVHISSLHRSSSSI